MKCVEITKEKFLTVSEIEKPTSEDGSVIIKVESCGICGSDIHYWDTGEPKKLVMGHEFCGQVVDPGKRQDLKVGDKVTGLPISPCGMCEACKTGNPQYCPSTWTEAVGLSLKNPGGFAEYTSCRADLVKKIPDKMSFDEGTLVEPSAVALHAVALADIKVGAKVLVIGGGIIGLMTCELAKLEGACYIAMLETNLARAKKSTTVGKADQYFDAKKENVIQELYEVTNGGFDIVIECCGNSAAVTEAFLAVKPGGKIILVGVSTGPVTIPTVAAVMKEVTVIGAIAYTEREFTTMIDLIANKTINAKKYIDDIVTLDKVQDSFTRLTNGRDDAVKIIVHPND